MKRKETRYWRLVRQCLIGLGLVLMAAITLSGFQKIRELSNVRQKVHKYVSANVLPVIQAERKVLEVELTGFEKAQVQELRERMAELRPRGESLQRKRLEIRKWDPEANRLQRQELDRILTLAENIITNHIQTIEASFANIREKRPEWREDIETLVGHDFPAGQLRRGSLGRVRHLGGHRHLRFLLLNPDKDPKQIGLKSNLRIYPNPSFQNSTLEYVVLQVGQVLIQVMDQNGHLVQTIYRGQKEPGLHRTDVDISNLSDGVYLVSVSTPSGTEARRIIKSQ